MRLALHVGEEGRHRDARDGLLAFETFVDRQGLGVVGTFDRGTVASEQAHRHEGLPWCAPAKLDDLAVGIAEVARRKTTIASVSFVKLVLTPPLMWGLCIAFGGDPTDPHHLMHLHLELWADHLRSRAIDPGPWLRRWRHRSGDRRPPG